MSTPPTTPRRARPSSDLGTPTIARQPFGPLRTVSSPQSPSTPRRLQPLPSAKTTSSSPTTSVQAFQRRHAAEYAHLHKHSSESLRKARLAAEEARLAYERRLGREKRASMSMSSRSRETDGNRRRSKDAWRPLSLLQHRQAGGKGHGRSMSTDHGGAMHNAGGMRATSQPTRVRRLSVAPRVRSMSDRPPLPPARPSSMLEVLVETQSSPPPTPPHSTISHSSSMVSKPGSTYSWATSFSGETCELRLASHYVPSAPPSPEKSEVLSSAEKTQRRRKRVVAIAHTARQLEGVGSRNQEDPELYWTLQRAWNERPGAVAQAELLPVAELPARPRPATGLFPRPAAEGYYLPPGAAPALTYSPNTSPAEPYFATPINQEVAYCDPSTYPSLSQASRTSGRTGRSSVRYSFASTLHDLAVDGGFEVGQRLMSEKAWLRTPQSDGRDWEESLSSQSVLSGPSGDAQSTPRAMRSNEGDCSPKKTTPERALRKQVKPIQRIDLEPPKINPLSDAPPALLSSGPLSTAGKGWGLGLSSWWTSKPAAVSPDFHLEPEPTPPDIPLPPTPPCPQMKKRISKDSLGDLTVEIEVEGSIRHKPRERTASLSSSPFRQTWTHWSTLSLLPRDPEAEVMVSGTLSERSSSPSMQNLPPSSLEAGTESIHLLQNQQGQQAPSMVGAMEVESPIIRTESRSAPAQIEQEGSESTAPEPISPAESGTLDPTQPVPTWMTAEAFGQPRSPREGRRRLSLPLLSGPLFSPPACLSSSQLRDEGARWTEDPLGSRYLTRGQRTMSLPIPKTRRDSVVPETSRQTRDWRDSVVPETSRQTRDERDEEAQVAVQQVDEGRLVWEYQRAAAAMSRHRPLSRTLQGDIERGMPASAEEGQPAPARRAKTLFWLGWILPFLWLVGGWFSHSPAPASAPSSWPSNLESRTWAADPELGIAAKLTGKDGTMGAWYLAWARDPDPWVRRCRIAAVSSTVVVVAVVVAVVVYLAVTFG